MKMKQYLFVYEQIDGRQFEVIQNLTSNEVAIESANIALSKHQDLKQCQVYQCELIAERKKPLL